MIDRMLENHMPLVYSKDYSIDKKDDKNILEIPVPGFSKEEIHIEVDNGILIIEGKDSKSKWAEDFVKKFKLPYNMDTSKIEAVITDGILMIEVIRDKKDLPKKVKIK